MQSGMSAIAEFGNSIKHDCVCDLGILIEMFSVLKIFSRKDLDMRVNCIHALLMLSEESHHLCLLLNVLFYPCRRKGTLDVEVRASGFTRDLEISLEEVVYCLC